MAAEDLDGFDFGDFLEGLDLENLDDAFNAFEDRQPQTRTSEASMVAYLDPANRERKVRKLNRIQRMTDAEKVQLSESLLEDATRINALQTAEKAERTKGQYEKRLAAQQQRETERKELGVIRERVHPSLLFDQEIIAKYIKDPDIRALLNDGRIQFYCNDEVLTALGVNARNFWRRVTKCCDFGGYMETGFDNVFQGKEGFQLLTAVDSVTREVLGFLTAERGECQLAPEVWSVNLICTATVLHGKGPAAQALSRGVTPISGIVMLGAMLYSLSILERPFAVLELAGGYTNSRGFIAYSKLGFIKNLSLFNNENGKRCFYDPGNLPMYVSLDHFTPKTIQALVSGRKRIALNSLQDDTGFFVNYLQRKFYTPEEGDVKNRLYQTYLCIKPQHKQLIRNCEMDALDKQFLYDAADELMDSGKEVYIPTQVQLPIQAYRIFNVPAKRGGMRRKRTRVRTRLRRTRRSSKRCSKN